MPKSLYLNDKQAEFLVALLENYVIKRKKDNDIGQAILDKLDDEKVSDEISKGVMITEIIRLRPELAPMKNKWINTKKQDIKEIYESILQVEIEKGE